MKRKFTLHKLVALVILALLLLGLSTPARAFTPMAGETVVIEEDQVIEDDLYVSANTFVLKGTVKGDLIAVGSLVRIAPTGVVTGDLMAAGQGVVVEGRVEDDARLAGMTVVVSGQVSDDLVAAGYSVETQSSGQVGGDTVVFAGQLSLGGQVAGNVEANAAAVAISGEVGGNVRASVGGAEDRPSFSPFQFMPSVPDMPQPVTVPAGLTFGSGARVAGNLTYTAPVEMPPPPGVVTGQVSYNAPPPSEEEPAEPVETPASRALNWFLNWLRTLATLLITGLLLAYGAPGFLLDSVDVFKQKPLLSFLWGMVTIFGFGVAFFLLVTLVLVLVVILGVLTLGDLVTAVVMAGIWLAFGLVLAYKLLAAYVAKIVVCAWFGLWALGSLKPGLAENRLWPVALGVVVFSLLWSIPYLGGIVNLLVILFGLGALFQLGRDWLKGKVSQQPPPVDAASMI